MQAGPLLLLSLTPVISFAFAGCARQLILIAQVRSWGLQTGQSTHLCVKVLWRPAFEQGLRLFEAHHAQVTPALLEERRTQTQPADERVILKPIGNHTGGNKMPIAAKRDPELHPKV